MRVLFTAFLLALSFNSCACANESKSTNEPFAFVKGNDGWKIFEIFVPEKYGEYYLTSIYLNKEQSIYVSLNYAQAFVYPGYKQSFIELNANTVDDYDLYVSYTTTEDGGMVICGGNVIQTKLKPLLSAEKPVKVIPPPSPPKQETARKHE